MKIIENHNPNLYIVKPDDTGSLIMEPIVGFIIFNNTVARPIGAFNGGQGSYYAVYDNSTHHWHSRTAQGRSHFELIDWINKNNGRIE